MDETLDKKLDAVMIELGTLNTKLDALLYYLSEDIDDEPNGDEYGTERNQDQAL